ncbi:GvpL/GvpF family gas vesicle protein [Terriglobus aquaticus]|uniref:GvpL/GvpF family gas vesicle protein n=1 Tax=Terriglobus aquaticus TaxID=940139 RepID=A0ABW9KIU8_9BACT|nr:GvpL/GvpF family gas vesicle protein [Terriglobus aquaticus]
MSWYAYCIAERSAFPELLRHRRPMPLERVSGLFGNQIFLFPASDLAIVVSEHNLEDDTRVATPDNPDKPQRDHARVIAATFKHSPVLPFRFGTSFQDDDALRRAVRSNHRHFTDTLERLRGKAEMHLKVLVDDNCAASKPGLRQPTSTGKEYLSNLRETASAQRERQSRARALQVQMHRMFLPIEEEVTCKRAGEGKMLLDIAHLIDSKCVERYQNKYSTATNELKGCQMQLSGPWPPYHFVHRNHAHA